MDLEVHFIPEVQNTYIFRSNLFLKSKTSIPGGPIYIRGPIDSYFKVQRGPIKMDLRYRLDPGIIKLDLRYKRNGPS